MWRGLPAHIDAWVHSFICEQEGDPGSPYFILGAFISPCTFLVSLPLLTHPVYQTIIEAKKRIDNT